MPINAEYRDPASSRNHSGIFHCRAGGCCCRAADAAQYFEPRYLAMVDDALRDGHADRDDPARHFASKDEARPSLFGSACVGRITQLAESGDGRYILELTGVARFKVSRKISGLTHTAMQG